MLKTGRRCVLSKDTRCGSSCRAFEGNINVKWLRRLKLGSAPFMTRWETAKYTELMPDGKAYQFTLVMEAKSVITYPLGQQRIQPGFHEITGLAWSGRERVTKVEVSLDGGRTWQAARLQEPVLSKCHTRFSRTLAMEWARGILQSRCLDETGYIQPSRQDLVKARGTNSIYHYNAIQSWRVERDGRVRTLCLSVSCFAWEWRSLPWVASYPVGRPTRRPRVWDRPSGH